MYEYEDGGMYSGEGEDLAHGYGCSTSSNGCDMYEGLWEKGRMTRGVYTWQSGRQYMGSWVDDRRDGLGKEVDTNGAEYIGDFTGGGRGPFGVATVPRQSMYQGSWMNGKQDGEGTEVYEDGGESPGLGCKIASSDRKYEPVI